jgi:hypothetical protein
MLRSAPRNPGLKLKYNDRKYSPADAQRIFERCVSRGYTIEEAAEATFALTGIKPEVKASAEA